MLKQKMGRPAGGVATRRSRGTRAQAPCRASGWSRAAGPPGWAPQGTTPLSRWTSSSPAPAALHSAASWPTGAAWVSRLATYDCTVAAFGRALSGFAHVLSPLRPSLLVSGIISRDAEQSSKFKCLMINRVDGSCKG